MVVGGGSVPTITALRTDAETRRDDLDPIDLTRSDAKSDRARRLICRSPSAEAVLRELTRREFPQLQLSVDSAGTHGYHVGEPPDPRSIAAGRARGYDLTSLRARKVEREDFHRFDWLLAMDEANLAQLIVLAPTDSAGRARLFLEFAGESERSDVPDPYYGEAADFELVLDLLENASRRLLRQLAGSTRRR